jgi:acetyl/propionyl-CoA carboxylase alpha subunit
MKAKKEKYIVAGYQEYSFDVKSYSVTAKKLHIEQAGGNRYIASIDKVAFQGEVLQLKQNKCTVLLNGNTYTFLIGKEETIKRKGAYKKSDSGSNIYLLKAPMPGKIVDVLVTKGAKVEKGEPLAVLEAMKMQNLLQAEEGGTVVAVNARVGDSVLGDQVLVELKID